MRMTLEIIRAVLRRTFGRESVSASFISRLEDDSSIATACINAQGEVRYNPSFVEAHIRSSADLFSLIMHELMHPLFGHFIYSGRHPLEAIGADMVINAVISVLFADDSNNGALFRCLYPDSGLAGLLRPNSRMHQSRYAGLYWSFYGDNPRGLCTGEAIQSLKILTPDHDTETMMLLGNHEEENISGSYTTDREVLARIAGELRDSVSAQSGVRRRSGRSLENLFIAILKTHMGLKMTLLQRYSTQRKVDRFVCLHNQRGLATSPVPLQPSRREVTLLAADIPLLHYRSPVTRRTMRHRGLAVYLDVSGSVNKHLPRIMGLLQGLRRSITSIFLFSNQVIEVPFDALLAGRVQTTYGTDFDCVAESLMERRLDQAIVLTDGHAELEEVNRHHLIQRHVRLLTILFGGETNCVELAPFGDVLQLDDVVE